MLRETSVTKCMSESQSTVWMWTGFLLCSVVCGHFFYDMSWMLLLSGLTWSYSWSAITTRTVRWLLTGQYQSASASIRLCSLSTDPSTVQPVTDRSTSKMSVSLVATPSRSQFLHAAAYAIFRLVCRNSVVCSIDLSKNIFINLVSAHCKWGSIPRVRGELAEDKGTSFGLQGGYATNHSGSGRGRHGSRGVCLPWLSYPLINQKHLWHQPPKCHH